MYAKKGKIYPAYVSKHNSKSKKQVILLIVSNGEKRERSKALVLPAKSKGHKAKSERRRLWHYLSVKKTMNIIKRNSV